MPLPSGEPREMFLALSLLSAAASPPGTSCRTRASLGPRLEALVGREARRPYRLLALGVVRAGDTRLPGASFAATHGDVLSNI
jgi:hypothetical protein